MFKNVIYYIGILLAMMLLMTTACTDSIEYKEEKQPGGSGEEITFEIFLQDIVSESRAVTLPYISDGKKVDQLIFCLYEQQEDKNFKEIEGDGQHIVDMSKRRWPYTVRLSLDPSKTYGMAFWAHKGTNEIEGYTSPYDVTDLRNVKVSYKNSQGLSDVNNLESRDAFCASIKDITVAKGNRKVVMHRAMAQINLGTSGADYANLIYDPLLNPSRVTINESKIAVSRVANRLDVLTGKATAVDEETEKELKDTDEPLVADFTWAPLPAWINMEEVPTFPDDYENLPLASNPFVFSPGEEFLRVKLNEDGVNEKLFPSTDRDLRLDEYGFFDFKTSYPTKNEAGNYLTEKFKYLSMCYVLVPSSEDETGKGSTVDIKYDLQQKKSDSDGNPLQLTQRELRNVPVKANYRTNILGGLNINAYPDPSSIFNVYQMQMIMSDRFLNDFNVRYYTVNLTINRPDRLYDKLRIEHDEFGQDIPVSRIEDGIPMPQGQIVQTIYFNSNTGKAEYTFFMDKDHELRVITEIKSVIFRDDYISGTGNEMPEGDDNQGESEEENEPWEDESSKNIYNWWQGSRTEVDEETVSYKLTFFPGASAGSFTIQILKIESNPESETEPEPEETN